MHLFGLYKLKKCVTYCLLGAHIEQLPGPAEAFEHEAERYHRRRGHGRHRHVREGLLLRRLQVGI